MTDLHRESARIFTFPVKVRADSARKTGQQAGIVADLASRRLANAVFGSAWYHEAAVEEARQAADRK